MANLSPQDALNYLSSRIGTALLYEPNKEADPLEHGHWAEWMEDEVVSINCFAGIV